MNAHRRRLLGCSLQTLGGVLGLWVSMAAQDAQATDKPERFRTTTWEELVPKDWDPSKLFRERNLGSIREGSTNELALMREMRKMWDNAPTRDDLNGAQIRLPGYVVPLENSGDGVREFLLVPYFGACVHSPPPPANQIVHVVLLKPRPLRTMEAVWTSGTLSSARQDSEWGMSGYRLEAFDVEPYKAAGR